MDSTATISATLYGDQASFDYDGRLKKNERIPPKSSAYNPHKFI
jgi:hypothetical protein